MSKIKKQIVEAVLSEDSSDLKMLNFQIFEKILVKVAKKHESKATGTKSSYSTGGNFRAVQSDAYGVEKNVLTYEGHGGMFARQHPIFLKVGSAHGYELQRAVVSDVIKELKSKKFIPKDTKETNFSVLVQWERTDKKAVIHTTSGSAWGGIGYYFS